MNHVQLTGTLAQQPEMRYTSGGLAILELQLAGKTNDRSWYHRVTIFGKQAEALAETPVGAVVTIAGRLDYQTWEKDGQSRSIVKIVANLATAGDVMTTADTDARGQPVHPNGINLCMIAGNLTKDPEGRTINSGDRVCNAGMAINEEYKGQEKTHFLDVSAWREQAEVLEAGRKGGRVIGHGRVVTDSWEAQDGTKRYRTKVELDAVSVQGAAVAKPVPPPVEDEFPPDVELPF